ncbi:Gfo/Idh/MocA family protein [Paenibacillus ehimensis]|uniref:Gfo/Idh/MocA family oxidoreductase n=1 Tax=Paenibacillus ehimensis TaxID=79264 RepID=A0ABT8VF75_9BACL|nr:Gfo/Idh/MocA family oxidoreductase [Paenibacillus ehimensis]MDO3679638.1 Gfo/Idh/MocA family oxidoreductase [Paenibacillus ehimensis]
METTLRIGIIGLDTSHVTAFTKLLNDSSDANHVPGGRVIAAYPGGSADFPLSIDRVGGFTQELQEQYDVSIMETPEAVAESVDALLLESADGRVHLEQFRAIAPYGKPVFIDKPLALSSQEAYEIAELAQQYDIPVMSTSALRYSEGLAGALAEADGAITGADAFGPMHFEPTQPGYYWYGIHTAELLYRAMGAGCREVSVTATDDFDVLTGVWQDGRIGTVRGSRRPGQSFSATLHTDRGPRLVDVSKDGRPFYASLLVEVMKMFKSGVPGIPLTETLEIIRFLEAANESRGTGRRVKL